MQQRPSSAKMEWAKLAPRARVAKSKARLSAYEKLAAQDMDEKQDELVMQIRQDYFLGDRGHSRANVKKGYATTSSWKRPQTPTRARIVGVIS